MSSNLRLVSILCLVHFVSGQLTSDGPLNFTHDRTDGRLVWISSRTNDTVQKIEYRRLFRDSNRVLQSNTTGGWRQMAYDPRSPIWQKPDGICADYELNVTTTEGKSYTQVLEAPVPAFKSTAKPRVSRIFFDPIRNRVIVEIAWTSDFDFYTAAGAVAIDNAPWMKSMGCQSLFRQATPPPSMEGGVSPRGALFSFDPEYARNNCSFLFGVNGTLKMMQTPPQFGPFQRGGPQLITNGQLIQLPVNGGPIIQGPFQGPFQNQIPVTGQFIQRQPADDQCDKINFTTTLANETLILNLTCDTVSDSSPICAPPLRQCRLSCSPSEIHAYNMQDNGEYLKIEWQFPENVRQEIRRYQIRYAEANVTPWNTVVFEKEPTELSLENGKYYVEIKNYSDNTGSGTNFTLQICANLGQLCNTGVQWDQERKYAIGYTPRQVVSANLVHSEAANSRRRAKNAGLSHTKNGSSLQTFVICLIAMKMSWW